MQNSLETTEPSSGLLVGVGAICVVRVRRRLVLVVVLCDFQCHQFAIEVFKKCGFVLCLSSGFDEGVVLSLSLAPSPPLPLSALPPLL
jgi:hypothetical protein